MKIKVTKDNVTIYKDEKYHAGEYNIHDCTFEFSEEYTDILVKKALFGVDGKFYEMSILNNQCEIPYDVLKSNGMVILGVYAYEVLEDKLKLRYSPMYDTFFVNLGSYQENIENQEEITFTQFEQYMQALQNGLAEVQSSIDKLNKTTDNANNLVDDINKKLESGEFDGVGITTITSGQATQQDDSTVTSVTVNKTDGSQQIFNVSAKNGINGTDGTDGTNGQDGITPNLQIGTVTTLEPNEQATVTRTGTDEEPLFNFGIPRGQTYQVNNEDLQNIANQITSNANSSFNQNVKNKTDSFNENSSLKTNEFNNNAAQKTLDYNNNCISKTNSFNQNSTQKLTEFNDNYTSKLNSFNSNANLRMDEYNANADNKIAEYDEHSQELNNKIIDTRNELERVKNDVLETGTDTDTFVHLEDSAMAELQELEVDGVCEQNTTSGKNLFNENQLNVESEYQCTTSISNKVLTITSTSTGGVSFCRLYPDLILEPNTNYSIGFDFTGNINQMRIYEVDGNNYINVAQSGTGRRIGHFTTNSNTKYRLVIYVEINKSMTVSNIQFEKGTTATSYEPYTGGQPSPNPDYPQEIKTIENSLKITSCNKNLFDKDNVENDYRLGNDGLPFPDASNILSQYIKVKPNNTYHTNFKLIWSNRICEYSKDKTFILKNQSGLNTFTTSNNCEYIRITCLKTQKDKLQLQQGTQVTLYEQHLETQITANLPEGEFIGKINDTYKDRLKIEYNEEDGQYHLNLYKNIGKVVLDGSSGSFTYNRGINSITYNDINDNLIDVATITTISNYFVGCSFNDRGNLTTPRCYFENNYLQFRGGEWTDTNSFKTWLSTHNTEVYYALAEPYTLDLGIVDMPITYNEVTNLFTDSDLLPTITAKYYRNFISTVRNLQVNEKALKQELIDINNRLSALESANTNVASESEVVE